MIHSVTYSEKQHKRVYTQKCATFSFHFIETKPHSLVCEVVCRMEKKTRFCWKQKFYLTNLWKWCTLTPNQSKHQNKMILTIYSDISLLYLMEIVLFAVCILLLPLSRGIYLEIMWLWLSRTSKKRKTQNLKLVDVTKQHCFQFSSHECFRLFSFAFVTKNCERNAEELSFPW